MTIELKHDTNIDFTVYRSPKANTFLKYVTCAWSELLEQLSTYKISTTEKYASGVVVYGQLGQEHPKSKHHREDSNIIHRSVIALDFDGLPMELDFISLVKNKLNCAFCIYSTYNHGFKGARYRLLIPLSHNIDKDTYKFTASMFGKYISKDFDTSSATASQCQALPVLQSEQAPRVFYYHDEQILDSENLKEKYQEAKQRQTQEAFTVTYESTTSWDIAKGGVIEGSNPGRNQACTSLFGLLLRRYVPLDVAIPLIEHWNASNVPPLTDKELKTVFKSIIKKETIRRGKEVN